MIRESKTIVFLLIFFSFLIGILLYPQMPKEMVSHWGIQGEVNGYLPKFWGLFLMPILTIFLFLLFILIPKVDPLKANIAKFKNYYDWFVVLLVFFLFYLYLLTIFWNLGRRFNLPQFLSPAIATLFYYLGVLTKEAKRNWFVGIRTPWTLSSDAVWEKTHKIGGKLFKIAGAIAFLGIFFPQFAFAFILLPALFIVIYTTAYSYLEYKKVTKT